MGKLRVTDFILYRWRYALGFLTVAVLLMVIIAAVTFLSPGGISQSEMNSTVTSTFTQPQALLGQSPEHSIHLPYRLFQKLSLAAFGVNLVSIKLPSIMFAIGSVLALYGLLRLWFRRNVAVITSIITVVTGQFLLLSQLGTPAIGYIFWNAAMLYSASMLAQTKKLRPVWFVTTAMLAAVSLYSPLQLYAVFALAATCLIHPHARFVVLKQSKWVLGLGIVVFLALVAPLVVSVVQQPSLLKTLLGIPADFAVVSLEMVKTQLSQYAGFYKASSDIRVTPAYGLGIIALVFVGLYRLFTTKYTAKSYIITIWFLLLLPAILINPDAVMVTFVPVVLLIAYGIDYLIRSWYRLFPQNPYARLFGLAPLSVLVVGLILSGVERFVYGYHYDPKASHVFTRDLSLLDTQVEKHNGKTITIIVPENQRAFYTIYAERKRTQPKVVVTSNTLPSTADITLAYPGAATSFTKAPSSILVSATSNDADRFYLYKK